MIYLIWTIITLALSITGMIEFKPYYHTDDMANPLFTDFTAIALFLPSYFISLWLLTHIIYIFVSNQKIKVISIAFVLVGGFILSLNFLDFYSITIKILVSVIVMSITFIYFLITTFLFRKSKLFNKHV